MSAAVRKEGPISRQTPEPSDGRVAALGGRRDAAVVRVLTGGGGEKDGDPGRWGLLR